MLAHRRITGLTTAAGLAAFTWGSAIPRQDALVQVIAAGTGNYRVLEGRLAGVPGHQPFRPSAASPRQALDTLTPDALGAYDAIRRRVATTREPRALIAAAESELLLGRSAGAVGLLHECLADARCPPDAWSDLAAAYLSQSAEGGRDSDAELDARAIDAATRATSLAPDRAHAWFNLGLALSRARLTHQARNAWDRFSRLEASAAWRLEVRERQLSETDPAAPWTALKARLLAIAESAGVDLHDAASRFAERSRDLMTGDLLPGWGRAWLAGRFDEAAVLADKASALAHALELVDGDTLLVDCAAHVERLSRGRGSDSRDLANGHVALGDAQHLYEDNRRDDAAIQFGRAALDLAAAGSPCAIWSTFGITLTDYHARRLALAGAKCADISARARTRGAWALLGKAQATAGAVYVESSDVEHGLRSYAESFDAFERAREPDNGAAVANGAADALRLLGEHRAGWAMLGKALQRMDQTMSARRRYVLLLNASLFAADDDMAWAALTFQNASLDAAYDRGIANTIVEGLIRRARLHLQVHNVTAASADLDDAARRLPQITSTSSIDYEGAWLTRVRAELSITGRPADAMRLIDDALIAYFANREPEQVPQLLLARGRAALNAHDAATAEASLQRGLAVFQSQWRALASREHRVSYTDQTWDLFDELIRLRAIREADPSAAIAYAEAARGQHAGPGSTPEAPRSPAQLAASAGTAILYYVSLNDILLAWRIDADGVHAAVLPVDREELARQVSGFRQLLQSASSEALVRTIGAALYERLVSPVLPAIGPIARVVIVPDGALYALPFAALSVPGSGRFLFEDRSVVVAPSLKLYEEAQSRLGRTSREPLKGALLVGNALNPDPSLAALPGAVDELSEIARTYDSPLVLSGQRATAEAFGRASRTAGLIHFAGHAKANLAFPWASALFLTPDRAHASGILTAREVATWSLPNTRLVVLGACDTAYGGLYRGEGLVSLARPFIDLGVPSVVGALWDVDDRATRTFLVTFHREYAVTGDAARSLRVAQSALASSPDPTLRLPRNWSAFVAFGASGGSLRAR